MSVGNERTEGLRDRDLPAVAVLLGDGVPAPLSATLAPARTTVETAAATQVTWWPGRSITVRYRVTLRGGVSGPREMVAVSGSIPEGAAVVSDGESTIGVWLVPFDPGLPGLASAMDEGTARRLMADLGAGDGLVRSRLRAYRPGRRAVVEIIGERWRVFVKIVPPSEVNRLHHTHLELEKAFPVPRTLGFDRDLGVVALHAMPGLTLRRAFEDAAEPLPPPPAIEQILRGLSPLEPRTAVRSPIERLPEIAGLLSLLLPEEAGRVARLVDRIGSDGEPATVASHGDFHEAQILVAGGSLAGLLDLDTFGEGRPGDDPATMLGHLATWRQSTAQPDRVAAYGRALLGIWEARIDPDDLRLRAAAVVAALATGPFRVQRPSWPDEVRRRLDLAERWADTAHGLDERDLITASGSVHDRPAF